jgi:DNA-binding protein Fis
MVRRGSVNSKAAKIKKGKEFKNSCSAVEGILEQKIEDVVNFLHSAEGAKSRLHNEILAMVERCLIKIALKRSNNVKTSAATFLGINRNTLHQKMEKLDIPYQD